ncbi:hypothetical protein VP01_10006g1, partial [Puccinia sorghi]
KFSAVKPKSTQHTLEKDSQLPSESVFISTAVGNREIKWLQVLLKATWTPPILQRFSYLLLDTKQFASHLSLKSALHKTNPHFNLVPFHCEYVLWPTAHGFVC